MAHIFFRRVGGRRRHIGGSDGVLLRLPEHLHRNYNIPIKWSVDPKSTVKKGVEIARIELEDGEVPLYAPVDCNLGERISRDFIFPGTALTFIDPSEALQEGDGVEAGLVEGDNQTNPEDPMINPGDAGEPVGKPTSKPTAAADVASPKPMNVSGILIVCGVLTWIVGLVLHFLVNSPAPAFLAAFGMLVVALTLWRGRSLFGQSRSAQETH